MVAVMGHRLWNLISQVIVYVICFADFLLSCVFFVLRNRLVWTKVKCHAETYDQNLSEQPTDSKKISVIICTGNDARSIGKTLRNLESTTINKPCVQIIIVDCGSNDYTSEVAKASMGAISVTFTALGCKSAYLNHNVGHLARMNSWNEAVAGTTGEIVLLLQPNIIVPPGWDLTLRREFSTNSLLLAAFKCGFERPKYFSQCGMYALIETVINLKSILFRQPRSIQGLAILTTQLRQIQAEAKLSGTAQSQLTDMDLVCHVRALNKSMCGSQSPSIKTLNQVMLAPASSWESQGILRTIVMEFLTELLHFHLRLSLQLTQRITLGIVYEVLKRMKI